MAMVLYSATVSLDGFMAGPGGDMSWLTEHLGPNPEVDALIPRIGALLVGNRTYGGDDPNRGTDEEGPFNGRWSGPQFVVTHRPGPPRPGVTFGDFASSLAAAKEAAGDGYVNVLGAEVGRQCLEAGELDEVLIMVAPVLLGDGTPFFPRRDGKQIHLEIRSATPMSHGTNLWYRVPR